VCLPVQGVGAAERPAQRRDDQAIGSPIQALPSAGADRRRATRRIRAAAWTILVALAAYQAYANRYVIGPDGMSYLDLSDGIVGGHWTRLVNLYWSPLYPALIGFARLLSGAGAESEIAVVHAVNLLCFVTMLGAFDYMLMSILSLAERTRRSALSGPRGVAGAYALFGCFALTMIPLELTTPDLLNAAASLAALGAMLRLADGTPRSRDALVLGAALGVGALTKSFMVPWGVVCFAVTAVSLHRRGRRPLALAIGVWLLALLPWGVLMTRAAGRPTFGDAGRLTYAWYVNGQDPPSLGGVPPGARRTSTERILPGAGVPGDTLGSDPMWFDPARWNRTVVPRLSVRDQLLTLKVFELFYIQNLTPLLFLFLLFAIAPRGSRREAWRGGWVVYLPAAAGLAAYAMVIVTARYVMPFVLAGTLTLLATLPLPRRINPHWFLLGLAVPIVLEAVQPQTAPGLALVASVLGGALAGVLIPPHRRVLWVVTLLAALIVTRVVLPPVFPELLRVGAAGLAVVLWRASLAAVRNHRTLQFAGRALSAFGVLLFAVLLLRLGLRLGQDHTALARAASPGWGNVQWKIASDLGLHGLAPGERIALIGPHAESYWVRTGRMHIVANVPRTRAEAFWRLPRPAQDALLREFALAGATVVIASVGPSRGVPDGRWVPLRYHGWIRPLAEPTQ
jgi:hypothetical protein